MNADPFHRAYRLALGLALAYVLWLLVPAVAGYASLVVDTTRQSRMVTARAASQGHCGESQGQCGEPRSRAAAGTGVRIELSSPLRAGGSDWDYVCRLPADAGAVSDTAAVWRQRRRGTLGQGFLRGAYGHQPPSAALAVCLTIAGRALAEDLDEAVAFSRNRRELRKLTALRRRLLQLKDPDRTRRRPPVR